MRPSSEDRRETRHVVVKSPAHLRWIAAATLLVLVAVVAACASGGPEPAATGVASTPAAAGATGTPAATSVAGTPAATGTATDARTPTPSPGRGAADRPPSTPGPELRIDRDTSWREVFETLTAAEQACIRDALGDGVRELLARHIMSDGATSESEVAVFACLAPDTARAVFLAAMIAGIEEDFSLGEPERTCLREVVAGLDVPAFMTATIEDDGEAVAESAAAVWKCVPELLVSGLIGDTGALGESERACLREWVRGVDVAALFIALGAGDEAAGVELTLGLLTCAPALLLARVTGEEAGEEAEQCLHELLAGTDLARLADEERDVQQRFFERIEDCARTGAADVPAEASGSADDHADTSEGATSIAVGEDVRGSLESFDDVDFFAFEAERGVLYEINVTLGTLPDSALVLYDRAGNELEFSDDYADSLASRIYWEATYSGTHYLEVWGFDRGSYILRVVVR